MATHDSTTVAEITTVAGVEARPGWTLIDGSGNDWSWAYVIHRPIEGFPRFCIGSDGSIWRWHTRSWRGHVREWRRHFVYVDTHGYLRTTLGRDGKRPMFLVHRLVLTTFAGSCPTGKEGGHTNNVRCDARLANLIWCTRPENSAHRIATGLVVRGEAVKGSKLTPADVMAVRRMVRGGLSQHRVATRLGVSVMTVNRIVLGKVWKHVPDEDNPGRTEPR